MQSSILSITTELENYIRDRYKGKQLTFDEAFEAYLNLPVFKPNGNIYDVIDESIVYNEDVQLIVRLTSQYYMEQFLLAQKFNLADENVAENLQEGNIGTAGRIAKVFTGASLSDSTELGCGRWTTKPRLAVFPNTNTSTSIPITKRIDIVSNCSHHAIPFTTFFREDSYAIISYIPDKFVLGISKLQRLTDWIARRYWLQEDLTKALYDEISAAAQTPSVYVRLINAVHGCESLRGSQSKDGAFSSEMFGGAFEDANLRKEVQNSI